MSLALLNSVEADPDELGPLVDAIDELIADAGVRAVVAAVLRSKAGEDLQKHGGNQTLRISQVILREIAFSQDPQLEAEIMALGAGVMLEDKATITKLARKHGLTKQAISKRMIRFCVDNGLPPSSYMRPERDRETYSRTNRPRIA